MKGAGVEEGVVELAGSKENGRTGCFATLVGRGGAGTETARRPRANDCAGQGDDKQGTIGVPRSRTSGRMSINGRRGMRERPSYLPRDHVRSGWRWHATLDVAAAAQLRSARVTAMRQHSDFVSSTRRLAHPHRKTPGMWLRRQCSFQWL